MCAAATAHAEPAASERAQPSPEEKQEATRAFLSGKDYFDSGRFAEAQEQFQKAYLLTKDPALLYNLGQTYRKMGRCPEARRAYEQFLQAAPDSPLAGRAQRHLAAVESSCAAATASAPTADAPVAATGAPGDAQPGVSSAPIASGAPKAPGASRAPARASLPEGTQRAHARPSAAEADAPWQWLPWATMVSGLVGAGTAVGLVIYNGQRIDRWDAENRNLKQGPSSGETDEGWAARQRANDRLDLSIRAVQTGAIATGIAGAVLIVASGVMFRIIPAHSSTVDGAAGPPSALHVRITSCDVTSTGVTLSGAF